MLSLQQEVVICISGPKWHSVPWGGSTVALSMTLPKILIPGVYPNPAKTETSGEAEGKYTVMMSFSEISFPLPFLFPFPPLLYSPPSPLRFLPPPT